MDVLDDEHHGPISRGSAQRGLQRLRRPGAGGDVVAEFGEDLVHRRVRRTALGDVEAVPGHDDRTCGGRPLGEFGDQARLTDSRVATHEHGRRGPGNRCFEGDDQLPQLFGPPDEPRTRHP